MHKEAACTCSVQKKKTRRLHAQTQGRNLYTLIGPHSQAQYHHGCSCTHTYTYVDTAAVSTTNTINRGVRVCKGICTCTCRWGYGQEQVCTWMYLCTCIAPMSCATLSYTTNEHTTIRPWNKKRKYKKREVCLRQQLCNCLVLTTSKRRLIVRGRGCLLYTSPSPRDATLSRMPSSA